jgi:hypothetical protein
MSSESLLQSCLVNLCSTYNVFNNPKNFKSCTAKIHGEIEAMVDENLKQ